ncbi:MAG: hypothetical protein JW723_02740 [Bacteroidales bacterium]|nr:hypothetical protein [Bacteroidales bacterium]
MKKLMITSILALLLAGGSTMRAQDWPEEYLGLPGDNLNLYAVMDLFQESETLEGFERNLNDENSRINNLDLNGDNIVDYITVSDYVDGNIHTIVLRALLSRKESQDVAVFTVEQMRNGEVRIQLIGDEALYGRNYIIEPIYAETPNPGYRGMSVNRTNVRVVTATYYDIAAWPVIRFMFHPAYIVWRSSWYWGYYPVYWISWRPYYWHYYYGYHYHWYTHYYSRYHFGYHCYYAHYHDHYYRHIRHHSPVVRARIEGGYYKATYSRPEQRKEGEALYVSINANRGTRRQINTGTGNQEKRTTVQTAQSKRTAAAGTETTRRTTGTAVKRTAASPSATKSSATARSLSSSVSQKTASRPSTTVQRTKSASSPGSSPTVRRSANSPGSSAAAARTASRSSSQVNKSTSSAYRSSDAKRSATDNTRRK